MTVKRFTCVDENRFGYLVELQWSRDFCTWVLCEMINAKSPWKYKGKMYAFQYYHTSTLYTASLKINASAICMKFISMAQCKIAVSPLLTHRRYCSFALSHRYAVHHHVCGAITVASLSVKQPQKYGYISHVNPNRIITWYDGFLPPVRWISAPGTTLFGPVVCLHCFNFVNIPPPP